MLCGGQDWGSVASQAVGVARGKELHRAVGTASPLCRTDPAFPPWDPVPGLAAVGYAGFSKEFRKQVCPADAQQ